jgi:hypothetical protein
MGMVFTIHVSHIDTIMNASNRLYLEETSESDSVRYFNGCMHDIIDEALEDVYYCQAQTPCRRIC